jgi:hypothetical protein
MDACDVAEAIRTLTTVVVPILVGALAVDVVTVILVWYHQTHRAKYRLGTLVSDGTDDGHPYDPEFCHRYGCKPV